MDSLQPLFEQLFGPEWGVPLFLLTKNLLLIVAIVVPLLLAVAYLSFA